MGKEKEAEGIIFQVRLNKEENNFELVKLELDNLVQSGLEVFLETYLESLKKMRLEDFNLDYFEEDKK